MEVLTGGWCIGIGKIKRIGDGWRSQGIYNGCRGKRRRCSAAGRSGMLRCEKAQERGSMIGAAAEGVTSRE